MTDTQIPDGLLVTRSQDGDREAFDILFERHKTRAYQFAHHFTPDPDEAADIVSDTLIRMFKAIAGFKGTCSITTWMFHITRTSFLDIVKKKKRSAALSLTANIWDESGGLANQIEDMKPSAFDLAARQERLRALRRALDRLPGPQKAILMMHHSNMQSHEEISQVLGLPVGTVKSRLNRARRRLGLTMTQRYAQEVWLGSVC